MSDEEVAAVKENPDMATDRPESVPAAPDTPKRSAAGPSDIMRQVRIDKVVVNIGVGEAGEKLQKAERVLTMITDAKPVRTISMTTNKDLGIRKYMPIGCKVTLRKQAAITFLEKAFWVRDNKIAYYSFDKYGNFSFGIPDYTEFQGMKYDPEIGIFGMDISVSLTRPGLRISRRRRMKTKVPLRHRTTEAEGKEFVKRQFKVEVVEE